MLCTTSPGLSTRVCGLHRVVVRVGVLLDLDRDLRVVRGELEVLLALLRE